MRIRVCDKASGYNSFKRLKGCGFLRMKVPPTRRRQQQHQYLMNDGCIVILNLMHPASSGGEHHSRLFYNLPYSEGFAPMFTGYGGTRPG